MEGTIPGEGGSLKGYLSLCTSCMGQSFFHALLNILTQHLKYVLVKFYTPGMTMNRRNISIVLLVERNNNCVLNGLGRRQFYHEQRRHISSSHLKDTFYIISIHSMS